MVRSYGQFKGRNFIGITHEYAAAAAVCRDFLVTRLEARVLWVDFSDLQDMFITIKTLPGNFEKKTRYPPYAILFSHEKCLYLPYYYIPRRKSGIYWIQVRRAAAVEISLWTR